MRRLTVATVAGWSLMATAFAIGVLANRDETTAYAIGAGFGSIALASLLVFGSVWIWRRFSKENRGPWGPTPLIVAGALAVLFTLSALGGDARERKEDRERFRSDAISCQADQPNPAAIARGMYRFGPVEPQLQSVFEQLFESADLPQEGISMHSVLGGRAPGVLLVIGGIEGDDDIGDLERGIRDAGDENGATSDDIEVAGEPVQRTVFTPRSVALAGQLGCYGFMTVSDPETAFGVTEQMITEELTRAIG